MFAIHLTIVRAKNGWIIYNDDNLEEDYVAKTVYGYIDSVMATVGEICNQEEQKCQQTENIKTD